MRLGTGSLRFVAKPYGRKWGVYDKVRGSWPGRTVELGEVKQETTEADALIEAERLNGLSQQAENRLQPPPEGP